MIASKELAVRKQVPTVPRALKALAAMERELTTPKTYEDLRRLIKEATALKILMDDVAEVKEAAEDAILLGNKRIAEELRKIPKAGGPGRGKTIRAGAKSLSGRMALSIPKDTRSRLGKLADQSDAAIKATAKKLRQQGKDATPTAVVRELTQGDKKTKRSKRERELAAVQHALPDRRFGVIVADPEWQFEPWSRDTGMDRAADNHYPTSVTAVIADRDVPSIAADDCALFLWATAPMLPHALVVMAAWGFNYVSNYVWNKDRIGTGYWNRNKHELLLIGTRGKVPCPAMGTQWHSVIDAPVAGHSEKPELFLQMIEEYFPNLPKIELNRRGPARPGWEAWGNEALEAAE